MYDSRYSATKGWTHFGSQYTKNSGRFKDYLRLISTEVPIELSSFLEVGFGDGSFMMHLSKFGANVTGIEINEDLVKQANDSGYRTLKSIEDADAESFDAIILMDIIEHMSVDQLLVFIRSCSRILKPNGIIFGRIPNGGSPFGLINQHGDLTHKTVLNAVSLSQLATYSCLDCRLVVNSSERPSGRFKANLFYPVQRFFIYCLEMLLALFVFGRKFPLASNLVFIMKKGPI